MRFVGTVRSGDPKDNEWLTHTKNRERIDPWEAIGGHPASLASG